MFKTLFLWLLDYIKDLILKLARQKIAEHQEEARVEEIVKKAESPNLPEAVDATDELEDEFNRNA